MQEAELAALTDQELTEELYRSVADLNDVLRMVWSRPHLHTTTALAKNGAHLLTTVYTKVPVRKEEL